VVAQEELVAEVFGGNIIEYQSVRSYIPVGVTKEELVAGV
jgi:hypothetical protein